MSDTRPHREWRFYIDDMIGFAEKVLSYTEALEQDGFTAHDLVYDATLCNLELIGEAATHIPDEVRAEHPLANDHCDTQQAGACPSGNRR